MLYAMAKTTQHASGDMQPGPHNAYIPGPPHKETKTPV